MALQFASERAPLACSTASFSRRPYYIAILILQSYSCRIYLYWPLLLLLLFNPLKWNTVVMPYRTWLDAGPRHCTFCQQKVINKLAHFHKQPKQFRAMPVERLNITCENSCNKQSINNTSVYARWPQMLVRHQTTDSTTIQCSRILTNFDIGLVAVNDVILNYFILLHGFHSWFPLFILFLLSSYKTA